MLATSALAPCSPSLARTLGLSRACHRRLHLQLELHARLDELCQSALDQASRRQWLAPCFYDWSLAPIGQLRKPNSTALALPDPMAGAMARKRGSSGDVVIGAASGAASGTAMPQQAVVATSAIATRALHAATPSLEAALEAVPLEEVATSLSSGRAACPPQDHARALQTRSGLCCRPAYRRTAAASRSPLVHSS